MGHQRTYWLMMAGRNTFRTIPLGPNEARAWHQLPAFETDRIDLPPGYHPPELDKFRTEDTTSYGVYCTI